MRRERTSQIQGTSQQNTWMREATDPDWVYGYDAWTAPLDPAPSPAAASLIAQSRTRDSRSALATTLTEDSAIAAAAIIGDSRMPNTGYSTPAAIGTPAAL